MKCVLLQSCEATNVELIDDKENPDNALARFELIEAIVRLAIAKYLDSGTVNYPSEAVKLMFETNIKQFANMTMCDVWRKKELYFERIDQAFTPFLFNLRAIFNEFSTIRYMKIALNILPKHLYYSLNILPNLLGVRRGQKCKPYMQFKGPYPHPYPYPYLTLTYPYSKSKKNFASSAMLLI